ncbi:MAG: hypothetical protein ABSH30_10860 [Acidimicrobiales bacterium]
MSSFAGEIGALRGQVDDVCFAQGLVLFNETWHLDYGMADSRIGCATAPRALNGARPDTR